MSASLSRDLRALAHEIGEALAERRQLPELIAFAVATFRELLRAEGVAILLLDAEDDKLYFPYSAEQDPGVAEHLSRIRFPAHRGIAGRVLRTGRSVRIDDVSADPWFFAGVDQETRRTTRSVLCAPLISARGTIGVIEAVNPRDGEAFRDADLQLLDVLAGSVARAIENVGPSPTSPAADAGARREPFDGTARDHVFRRQGEYWTITYDGQTFRLRHTKGLAYIAHLLRHPGREFHAIDLVDADVGPTHPRGSPTGIAEPLRRSLGDAGELLDPRARADYHRQLEGLRAELEEARGFNDPGRVERVQHEIDFLTQELARAVGLGGRARRAGSHAERARVNLTRAIASAVRKIAAYHAGLGRHFTTTIKTGTFCSYVPDSDAPRSWVL